MARDQIPDLWSDDIRADVLTPTMILKAQGQALMRRTKGLIVAEVVEQRFTSATQPELLVLRLDAIAAANDNQRSSLFSVAHQQGSPYPAALICPSKAVADWVRRSKALSMADRDLLPSDTDPERTVFTDTQTDFLTGLEALVRSNPIRSLLHSIIAASNEATREEDSQDSQEGEEQPAEGTTSPSDVLVSPEGT